MGFNCVKGKGVCVRARIYAYLRCLVLSLESIMSSLITNKISLLGKSQNSDLKLEEIGVGIRFRITTTAWV